MVEDFDFKNEEVLWRELLIYLVNAKEDYRYSSIIRNITPLNFDPALAYDYLQCMSRSRKSLVVMDEIEHHYSELENIGDRLAQIALIGNPFVYDNQDEDQDQDEDEDVF